MVQRGEIYMAKLPKFSLNQGSVEYGERPVLILQNNIGNLYSPTVICASISAAPSRVSKKLYTHVQIYIKRPSVIMLEQIHTIPMTSLLDKICTLDVDEMDKVNNALLVSLGLKTISEYLKEGEQDEEDN